jgi:ADP-heptose:LPS heptosyltransferase
VWLVNEKYVELIRWHPGVYAIVTVPCFGVWALMSRFAYWFVTVIDLHIHDRECFFCGLTQFKKNYDKNITLNNYYNHGSLAEAFSKETLLGPPIRRHPELYFNGKTQNVDNLPEKFIVFHPFSNEESRSWNQLQIGKFTKGFNGVPIVRIGAKTDPFLEGRELDFRGSLNLTQLIYVISKAVLFVGVDSGPAHIANALRKRALLLFAPYRNFIRYFP